MKTSQYSLSPVVTCAAVVSGWSTISHYVRGSDGLIAARASVKKSGIMPVIAPDMSFEQLRIMVQ